MNEQFEDNKADGENSPNDEKIKLESNFERIYRNFRLNIYKHIFEIMGEREGSLTATEFFAVETIGLMDNPTVSEFADCLSITSSHAAYKVHKLMEKGYIVKVPTADKRTYRLQMTEKFNKYYKSGNNYGEYIFNLISKSMTDEEITQTSKLFELFANTIDKAKDAPQKKEFK